MRGTIPLVISSLLLSSAFCQPVAADELKRLFGTIAGEIIKEQMRQPQQQQQRSQPQQQRRQQAVPQQQRRQQSAPQPQRQTVARQPEPQQPQMSLDERMAVQRALAAAGHYTGAIDGILGSGSRRAIASWQAAMGASPTGYLVAGQVGALVSIAPPPATAPAGQAPTVETATTPLSTTPEPGATATLAANLLVPGNAAPQPPLDAVVGDDALNDALMIWAAATRPELLDDPILPFTLARDVLSVEDKKAGRVDPNQRVAAVRAALPGPDAPAPTRAIIERRVDVRPAWAGQPASLEMPFAKVDGINTITGIDLEMKRHHARSPRWTLKAATPFFLPDPPGFEAWADPTGGDSTLALQLDVSLSDHAPIAGEFADSRYRGGTATVAVNRVTLLRRPKGEPGHPGDVLHVWDGGAPASDAPQSPADADAIAALFGGGVSDGRYVAFTHNVPALFPQPVQPVLAGQSPEEALLKVLALRSLAEAAPDRLPDIALTESLSQNFLTGLERMALLPVELAQGGSQREVSELTRHAAMTNAAPAVRDAVVGRAPDLPLRLRHVSSTYLGEYDFTSGGFRVDLGGSPYMSLPMAGPGPDMRPDASVSLSPDQAQELLDRIVRLNPSGGQGREVFVVIDYSLEAMTPRAAGGGAITEAELQTVHPRARIESAALFVDPALTEKLRDLDVPESAPAAAPAGGGPGEALFATTGLSLWGAFVHADRTGEITEVMLTQDSRFWPRGGQPDPTHSAALAEKMRAAALEEYWIGLRFTPGEYDPGTRRLQIDNVEFRAVPYDNDLSGQEPPPLVAADPAAYAALTVSADEAEQIQAMASARSGVAAYAKVRPVAAVEEADVGYGYALAVGAPEELMIGPDVGGGMPQTVSLRVAAPEPSSEAPATMTVADPTAPETLFLDQEGADLLALAADPLVYDDDAWTRMLVERLMRERWYALEDDPLRGSLPWGSFFADPSLTPDAGGVAAQLPAFKSWTQKRVAALPVLIAVPWGEAPQVAPNCKGMRDVLATEIPDSHIPLVAQATALLAGDATPAAGHMAYSERPRPGEDRLFLHESAPAHKFCRYPRQVGAGELENLIPPSAGHVSALIGARAVPNPGANMSERVGTTVVLRRDSLRLAAVDVMAEAPKGLRGVVVATGPVETVSIWHREARGYSQGAVLTPPDWALPTAPVLAATDVVGLTLGMPLAEFEAAARAHLGDAMLFDQESPGQGLFGHGKGLVNLVTGEALAAIYAPGAEGQPVIAIMRRLPLQADQADPAALQQSLAGKYGPVAREAFSGAWLWGTLPQEEDGWGVCGGESLLGRPERDQAPKLRPTGDLGQPEGSYLNRPDYWFERGWPEVVTDRPGQVDVSRCAPVVGAMVTDGGSEAAMLQVWLMDRKLAEDLDVPVEPVVKAVDIKL